MVDWRYPTAFSSWRYGDGGAESAAIDRVLKSDQLTMANETEAFEEEIAAHHGRRHAIAVNSGSSANLVGVAALGEKYGLATLVRVAVPAIAWATTYSPFVHFAAHLPNFIVLDVDATWNVRPPLKTITSADILVACPVLGNPAYLCLGRALANAYH